MLVASITKQQQQQQPRQSVTSAQAFKSSMYNCHMHIFRESPVALLFANHLHMHTKIAGILMAFIQNTSYNIILLVVKASFTHSSLVLCARAHHLYTHNILL